MDALRDRNFKSVQRKSYQYLGVEVVYVGESDMLDEGQIRGIRYRMIVAERHSNMMLRAARDLLPGTCKSGTRRISKPD